MIDPATVHFGYYHDAEGKTVWLSGIAVDDAGVQQAVWSKAQGATANDLRISPAESFFANHRVVYPEKSK